MSLLHPRPRGTKLRSQLTIGCPMARGVAGWCRGLCAPQDGLGVCGRVAPHALLSRYQLAILGSREAKQDGALELPPS